MRIHPLDCGRLAPPGGAWLGGGGPPWRRGRLSTWTWLLEGRGGLLLVDTGIGTAARADPRGRLGGAFTGLLAPALDPGESALARVRALGFDPRDVRDVVLTHLDPDHAGGLADFPHATVHLEVTELAAARAPATAGERRRYRPADWSHAPRWAPIPAGGAGWEGFPGTRPLPGFDDEVLLVPLPGHTRGHAGVAVRAEGRWHLHAGDAYLHPSELGGGRVPPGIAAWRATFAVDPEAARASRNRLAAASGRLVLGCTHAPNPWTSCSTGPAGQGT